jgi:hypothetical protein
MRCVPSALPTLQLDHQRSPAAGLLQRYLDVSIHRSKQSPLPKKTRAPSSRQAVNTLMCPRTSRNSSRLVPPLTPHCLGRKMNLRILQCVLVLMTSFWTSPGAEASSTFIELLWRDTCIRRGGEVLGEKQDIYGQIACRVAPETAIPFEIIERPRTPAPATSAIPAPAVRTAPSTGPATGAAEAIFGPLPETLNPFKKSKPTTIDVSKKPFQSGRQEEASQTYPLPSPFQRQLVTATEDCWLGLKKCCVIPTIVAQKDGTECLVVKSDCGELVRFSMRQLGGRGSGQSRHSAIEHRGEEERLCQHDPWSPKHEYNGFCPDSEHKQKRCWLKK